MAAPFRPQCVHLTGSVPLADAEAVFRAAGSTLGSRLRRVPDGETGDRINWIQWQMPLFANNPSLEPAPPDPNAGAAYAARPSVQLRPGVQSAQVSFGNLGYADVAKTSYAVFSRLRNEGVLPSGCRFQVSLPTPLAPVGAFVTPGSHAAVESAYQTQLLAELAEIGDSIPREDLAVQWDVAREFAILEGVYQYALDYSKEDILGRLVSLGQQVPTGAELGFHLCYGDFGHRHFKEPEDTSILVEVANALCDRIQRPVNWVHLPVPRDRSDDAYFAPLKNLKLKPETELYLGLVHYTDGRAGTQNRVDAAHRAVGSFGVATECGMGRRPPETIDGLLRILADMADPV